MLALVPGWDRGGPSMASETGPQRQGERMEWCEGPWRAARCGAPHGWDQSL